MGWFDRFRRGPIVDQAAPVRITAAALDSKDEYVHTYDNRNITFTGDLTDYDYDSILRDKQNNINSLYELSDY